MRRGRPRGEARGRGRALRACDPARRAGCSSGGSRARRGRNQSAHAVDSRAGDRAPTPSPRAASAAPAPKGPAMAVRAKRREASPWRELPGSVHPCEPRSCRRSLPSFVCRKPESVAIPGAAEFAGLRSAHEDAKDKRGARESGRRSRRRSERPGPARARPGGVSLSTRVHLFAVRPTASLRSPRAADATGPHPTGAGATPPSLRL